MTFLLKVIFSGHVILAVPDFQTLETCQAFGDNIVTAAQYSVKPKTYLCEEVK